VGPRAGLKDVERRKFLTLPGLERRSFGRPSRSQPLYRMRYPGSFLAHEKYYPAFWYYCSMGTKSRTYAVILSKSGTRETLLLLFCNGSLQLPRTGACPRMRK
jgi:hypothetical protein